MYRLLVFIPVYFHLGTNTGNRMMNYDDRDGSHDDNETDRLQCISRVRSRARRDPTEGMHRQLLMT